MNRKIKVYDENLKPELEYFDIDMLNKRLAFNADYTVFNSPRAVGKTYAGMTKASQILDKGDNVVWERYNMSELSVALETWQDFRPDLEKSTIGRGQGWKLTDPTTGGHVALIAWNIAQNAKGLDSPYIFEFKDEFIPERYTAKTRLDTEFADSMSVRKSIIRGYETRSIYFANCIQWINPYSIAWGVPPVDRGTFIVIKDVFTLGELKDTRTILWENIAMTPAMIERTFHTTVAGATSQEDVESYYRNATKQEYSRIAECPDKSLQLEPLQLMSQGYYMGYRIFEGLMYWTEIKPRHDIETYVAEPEYIDVNKKRFRDPSLSPQIESRFNAGLCVFDCPETLVALQRWLFHNRKRV